MSIIKHWLGKLFPSKRRIARDEWLATVTLPYYSKPMNKVNNHKPCQIHPLIDKYLTQDERYHLLLKYGWIEPISVNGGQKYYEVDYKTRITVIGKHLQHAEFMKVVNNNLMPFYARVKY